MEQWILVLKKIINKNNSSNNKNKEIKKGEIEVEVEVEKGKNKGELEKKREEIIKYIEDELKKQYNENKEKALKCRDKNDKVNATIYLNNTKSIKQHLMIIGNIKKDNRLPLPVYHIENREEKTEIINENIKEQEIVITIKGIENVNEENKYGYFVITMGYPSIDSPQKYTTSNLNLPFNIENNSNNEIVCKFQIERKKSFQLFCERKKIIIEMWQSKYLGVTQTNLGKGEIKLNNFNNEKCIINDFVDIKNGRKIQCKLNIEIKIKNPLIGKHTITNSFPYLIIDHFPTTTATTTNITSENNNNNNNNNEKITNNKEDKIEETNIKEWESVEWLISTDVLEWELTNINNKINNCNNEEEKEELIERKQNIEIKIQMLTMQAETGQLDAEDYFKQLRIQIIKEKQLAVQLNKLGNKDDAAKAMKRYKLMENELNLSLEQ